MMCWAVPQKSLLDGQLAGSPLASLFRLLCKIEIRGAFVMTILKKPIACLSTLALLITLILPFSSNAQTKVKSGWNFFSLKDDLEFGREAAKEIEKETPLVNDPLVQQWIDGLGRRLAAKTSMPNLPWRFRVANSREINAFALPGGYVYINRGLIDITNDESEIAGVLGHEMAHATLRHGTNQLSKALLLQLPLAFLSEMKGTAGIIGQIGSLGMALAFLKFSRSAEKNADILGVQTMTRAGYDPRGMVTIFEKLQRDSEGKGPQFLSDHPNPENRIKRIQSEIALLKAAEQPLSNSPLYLQAKQRLRSLPAAPSATTKSKRTSSPSSSRAGEPPSRNFATYRSEDGEFRIGYPANWEVYQEGESSVTFAPEWAVDGNDVTHGAMLGYLDLKSRRVLSPDKALQTIVAQLTQANPYLREVRGQRYEDQLAGNTAMATYLTGTTEQGYQERVWLLAQPDEEGVTYMLFIAPERDFRQYEATFKRLRDSLKFSN